MRTSFTLLLLFSLYSCQLNISQEIKPNIILINVDDMGWKDVGFMGSRYYETPNLDTLSSLGMVFSNAYAASANCAPSRACLMTGQWTPRHGIYTVNSSERGASKHRKLIPIKNTRILSSEHKVIPEVLSDNGYRTCHAGKWHLSDDPLEFGFDVNIGGGPNGHPRSYFPPYKNVNLKGLEGEYLTDLIMRKSLNFIDTVQGAFFLNYAPYAVHTPIQAVDSLLNKYEQKKAFDGQDNAAYASMIENLDRNIGLLIQKLKEKEIFDQTLLIFTSDNGGLYGITQQKPLRAGKGSYYEGGIREPFFVVLPEKIKPKGGSSVPVTNMDIFPTMLHYSNIDTAGLNLDGCNLSMILEEEQKELERPLFWHFPVYLGAFQLHDNENRDSLFRTRPGSAVRLGDWKLHYYFEDKGLELYNLAEDIGEQNNLANTYPTKRDELLNYLENWWEDTNAPIPTELNPEYEE
jgi:arylsulfatase A-like enzyme